MELNFIYSPILLIPGAIFLALGIYFFYFRQSPYKGTKAWILAALRFLALFAILFFLLQPFLINRENYSIKPHLIWLEDRSESMRFHKDSLLLDSALEGITQLKASLNEEYQQSWYSFAEDVFQDTTGNTGFTNIYQAISDSRDRFYSEPVAAMVLISDGIYNQGRNPIQLQSLGQDLAIYSLMHGNRQRERDLNIKALRYNKRISLGRILSLEADLEALNAEGQSFDLVLYDAEGSQLEKRSFSIDRKDWFESLIFEIPAEEEGFQNYQLRIEASSEDSNPDNNKAALGFEVLKEAFQIIVYSSRSHPDVAAIRRALSTELNWDLKYIRDSESIDFEEAKAVVAFDWDASLVDKLAEQNIPSLFFASAQSNIGLLGFSKGGSGESELQFGKVNTDFGLFDYSESYRNEANSWPPIEGIYGSVQAANWAETLLQKRIGDLDLGDPIAFSGELKGRRIGLFLGRGIWRWRVYNYKHQKNTDAFDSFFKSWLDYLQSQEREEDLILDFEKELYANQASKVIAKLYDPSGAMVNKPELSLMIRGSQNQQYEYRFSRKANFYRLKLDGLEPGFYRYTAKTTLGNRDYENSGRIWVRENSLEKQDLQAKRELLSDLSAKTGGKAYELKDWSSLLDELKEIDAPGQFAERKIKRELISKWWLFFVVLVSLSLEWFLRKFWGHY